MNDIIIPLDVREEILFPIGYPFLSEEEFDELLPENTKSIDVIQRFANKAIRNYNRKNPRIKKETIPTQGHFETLYPENAYGVLNVRTITIKGRGTLGPGETANTFSNLNTMTNGGMMAGGGGRAFGTPYSFGLGTQTFLMNKARMQGIRDTTKSMVVTNSPSEKTLSVVVNMGVDLRISWLMGVTSWDQISFSHTEEVMSMTSAYLLQWLGGLIEREQIGDLSVDLDGRSYIEQGKELETKIQDIWNSFPQVTTA
jgi:hypothetical protein